VLLAVKGNFIMAELSAQAPAVLIVVQSCRMSEKHVVTLRDVGIWVLGVNYKCCVSKVSFLVPVDINSDI
jgi:hypothetical protein